MRYISREGKKPDAAWREKATNLLEQLQTESDADARNAIIDANAATWRDLKEWLLDLSHGKCWFSEAKDCFSHWDVEHYRPKKAAKDVDGTEHEGYWWLAFDWHNFRICGNAGNRKKGTYFPLRVGCARCAAGGDLRLEDTQLLDPADPDDPGLISFTVEGRAVPAPNVTDPWEKERVEYSVERYNLDFPQLMDKRKSVWTECWRRVQEYRDELGRYQADQTNGVARQGFKKAAQAIREMMREERELSAVAKACVLSAGDERLRGLLQSV